MSLKPAYAEEEHWSQEFTLYNKITENGGIEIGDYFLDSPQTRVRVIVVGGGGRGGSKVLSTVTRA